MKKILVLVLYWFSFHAVQAQDDLLSLVDDGSAQKKDFITNAFKATRIVNTQSVEHLNAGVLDVRIMHRFGPFSDGVNGLYGFDHANMRMGFDYGISKRLMIGVGRSNGGELDGYAKYRLIWQAKGRHAMPFSMVIVAGSTMNTQPFKDTSRVNFFSSRMSYFYQVLIARKFSDRLTIQFSPTVVHRNLTTYTSDRNDVYSIGFGGRYKLTKRLAINWDYQYVLPGYLSSMYQNSVAIGFDIETGGHVFQVHVTNSLGMNERAFITGTTDKINNMGLRLGFNLSRVFTVVKPKTARETER